jgi:hypothetical protein
MAQCQADSTEFKRQVAQDCLAGETLHSLACRPDLCLVAVGLSRAGTRRPTPTFAPDEA